MTPSTFSKVNEFLWMIKTDKLQLETTKISRS